MFLFIPHMRYDKSEFSSLEYSSNHDFQTFSRSPQGDKRSYNLPVLPTPIATGKKNK